MQLRIPVVLLGFIVGLSPATAQDDVTQPIPTAKPQFHVLVFSKTAGFRHRSIPTGVVAIQKLGVERGFRVDATEDAVVFTEEKLKQYGVVVFLNTTGDVLDDAQQAAFEKYIRAGGGYVGVHAAADTEYEWPWYGKLVGAYFKSHPAIQEATVIVSDRKHPSTKHLPERWQRTDEWYNYRASPRGKVHVLASLDESTYTGGSMAADHPTAWCHDYDGGRAFYTGGGHTKECYADPAFLRHLLGGITWAAGQEHADTGATTDRHYGKVVLDDRVTDPMELAIASDGRVLFVERGGVKIWKPDTRTTVTAGFFDVFTDLEAGLLGVTLDPAFDENGRCSWTTARRSGSVGLRSTPRASGRLCPT